MRAVFQREDFQSSSSLAPFKKAQRGAGDDERLKSRELDAPKAKALFPFPKVQAPVTTPKALARACILSLSLSLSPSRCRAYLPRIGAKAPARVRWRRIP